MAILNRKSKNNGFSFMIAVLLLLFLLLQGQLYAVEAETQQKNSTAYPDTPEGVVEAFVKAGFEAEKIDGHIGDIEKRFQYTTEEFFSPGFDCFPMALDYRIAKQKGDINEVKVKVIYEYIGDICADVLHITKKTKKEVVYHLKKDKSFWKIYFPAKPPYISVKTAIKDLEHTMNVLPELKAKIKKNINVLRKILKESSN